MASEGPNNGGTFGNDSAVGTITWANPSYAETSNDSRASATLPLSESSYYLTAVDFGFTIPTDYTIVGVLAGVERNASDNFVLKDYTVRLIVDGTFSGDDKAKTDYWSITEGVQTYGGITDLWGLSLSYSQTNAADFGFGISVKNYSPWVTNYAYVDHIYMTVYYEATDSPEILTQTIERSFRGVLRGVDRGI